MSVAFSRSTRSLEADSFRPAFTGLVFAIVLTVAWGLWFLLAQITLVETSSAIRLGSGGIATADFPAESLGRIKPGQPAVLRLRDGKAVTIPVVVIEVAQQTQPNRLKVSLFSRSDNLFRIAPSDLKGQVEIEVERVSPATLVLRASGQALGTSSVSLRSPQGER